MKKITLLLISILMAGLLSAQEESGLPAGLYAKIRLSEGDLIFRLYEKEAPLAVLSFVGLAEGSILPGENGAPYYQNLTFYRIIKGYALFSGDPENSGEGLTGISFSQEKVPSLSLADRGVLAYQGIPGISRAGKFFITLSGDGFLNQVYTPFGKIEAGAELLDKIKLDDPVQAVEILRVGPEAMAFRADEAALAEALAEEKKSELENLKVSNPELAAFLESLPDYEKTDSGIYYFINAEGAGDKPVPGETVSVHYQGMLLNGQIFDSSVKRGTPYSLVLGKDPVITGWVEALLDMKAGENRIVAIPPELAYGERGAGGIIPPNSWLVFQLQLLGIQ